MEPMMISSFRVQNPFPKGFLSAQPWRIYAPQCGAPVDDERKLAKAIQPKKPLEQQARPHTNNSKTPMPLYAQVIKTSPTITIP